MLDAVPHVAEVDHLALPSSLDAEREVLASVLIRPLEVWDVPELLALRPEDFYARRHADVFRAMRAVHERGEVVDLPMLVQQLKDTRRWEAIGGNDTLSALLDRLGSTERLPQYARTVLRLAQRRAVVERARDVERQAMQPSPDNEDVARLVDSLRDAVVDSRLAGTAAVGAADTDAAFEDWLMNPPLRGDGGQVVSDLPAVNSLFVGDSPGLHFFGARSGGGKSVLLDNHVALPTAQAGGKVLCFHLEMPAWKVQARRVSKLSGVAFTGLVKYREQRRNGEEPTALTPYQLDAVWAARQQLRGLEGRMQVDDTPGLTADDVGARIRAAKAEMGGLDLVVIDHLNKMRHPTVRGGVEGSEINATVQKLDELAKSLDLRMVIASQFRKDRGGAPEIGDFYASNRVEWDALTATALYRPDNAPLYGGAPAVRFLGLKNRDGEVWRAWLGAELQFMRFTEVG